MTLGERISYYRKERGLSQEKLAGILGITRQAVTKWENDASRPSSENLLRLAEVLDVKVDQLLGAEKETEEEVEMGNTPWVYFAVSVCSMIGYLIYGLGDGKVDIGIMICLFTMTILIQLFLHLYFSSCIKSSNFSGVAGYDSKVEYNITETKRLLVKIDQHIGMSTAGYVAITAILGALYPKAGNLLGILVALYVAELITIILYHNYQSVDRIYVKREDALRARAGFPNTIIYMVLAMAAVIGVMVVFERKSISNNTIQGLKVVGFPVFGILIATVVLFLEEQKMKKWKPGEKPYRISKSGKIGYFVAAVIISLMVLA